MDYQIDWLARLGADTISTSVWIVPTGLTLDSDDIGTTTTTAWLSGGVLGTTYEILNRITTIGGRTMDQTVVLPIVSR